LAADAKAAQVGARAEPSEPETVRGSTSGLADRREPVQVLVRDQAGRLQQSLDLAARAKAVRGEVENAAATGPVSKRRYGSRAVKILAASPASGRQADLRMHRGNPFVRKAPLCGPHPLGPRARSSLATARNGLRAGAVRGQALARASAGVQGARRAGFRGRAAQGIKKDARGRAVGNGLLLHSAVIAARDSAAAKERGAQTQEERNLHSARGRVVSRGRASREDFRGQADFQSRAGRAAARIAVALGLAESGRADVNSRIERPWNGE